MTNKICLNIIKLNQKYKKLVLTVNNELAKKLVYFVQFSNCQMLDEI